MDQRVSQFTHWLANQTELQLQSIQQLQGDASTRRYFRIIANQTSYILMDAPSQTESLAAFLLVTDHLQQQQVCVPEIIAQNTQDGFLLLSDFGDNTLYKLLNTESADSLYHKAIDTLIKIQTTCNTAAEQLPLFDRELMQTEMGLFTEWFLDKQLTLSLDQTTLAGLQQEISTIINTIADQPYLYCHRDYHSRNLMLHNGGDIGVIDYQDAVQGPITYDLVSLLRDCYIKWPLDRVHGWIEYYYQQAKHLGLVKCSFSQFLYWFDWTGIQRHMKAIGIFSRLNLHYQKPGYLLDIPRSTNYLVEVTACYPELQALHQLVNQSIKPEVDRCFIKEEVGA